MIRPALAHGTWVVSDRFVDSTRVYQGHLGGVPQDLIASIEAHSVAPTFPDLTVILDLPASESQKRTEARGALSRFDAAHTDYHERLREAFRAIARAEPERCLVLDGARAPDEIAADVWSAVESRLLAGAR